MDYRIECQHKISQLLIKDFQTSLRELQLLKKRAYDHHGERFVLRPKALDLIENLQIGFHLYLLQVSYIFVRL